MAEAIPIFPHGEQLVQATNARVVGSGSTVDVVFAHGFGSNQSVWKHVLPAVIGHHKVLLFDWPGSATTNPAQFHASLFTSFSSFARLVLALLDHINVQACTFVGHSMGAMIGCIASAMQPLRFHQLVLVGPSPRFLNDGDYYGGFKKDDLDQLFAAMERDYQGWAANFAPLIIGAADPEAVDKFRVMLSSMEPDVAIALARTIFESDHRHVLADVRTKTHIIQTAKDFCVPAAVAEYMQRHIGQTVHGESVQAEDGSRESSHTKVTDPQSHPVEAVTLEVLATEGHIPQLTAPELLSISLQRIL